MRLNRRASIRLIAGGAAAAPTLLSQAPAQQTTPTPVERDVQSAKDELQDSSRRIAGVKLPRSTEPAFQFRA
jgi:hypothetical protein